MHDFSFKREVGSRVEREVVGTGIVNFAGIGVVALAAVGDQMLEVVGVLVELAFHIHLEAVAFPVEAADSMRHPMLPLPLLLPTHCLLEPVQGAVVPILPAVLVELEACFPIVMALGHLCRLELAGEAVVGYSQRGAWQLSFREDFS